MMTPDTNSRSTSMSTAEADAHALKLKPQRVSEHALRRLSRLHARMLGAQDVAQVAAQVAQAAQQRFQDDLAEACEEIGVKLPAGQMQAQIDWRTGEFSFEPAQSPAPGSTQP